LRRVARLETVRVQTTGATSDVELHQPYVGGKLLHCNKPGDVAFEHDDLVRLGREVGAMFLPLFVRIPAAPGFFDVAAHCVLRDRVGDVEVVFRRVSQVQWWLSSGLAFAVTGHRRRCAGMKGSARSHA